MSAGVGRVDVDTATGVEEVDTDEDRDVDDETGDKAMSGAEVNVGWEGCREVSLKERRSSRSVGAGVVSASGVVGDAACWHAGRRATSSTKISREMKTLRVEGQKHR